MRKNQRIQILSSITILVMLFQGIMSLPKTKKESNAELANKVSLNTPILPLLLKGSSALPEGAHPPKIQDIRQQFALKDTTDNNNSSEKKINLSIMDNSEFGFSYIMSKNGTTFYKERTWNWAYATLKSFYYLQPNVINLWEVKINYTTRSNIMIGVCNDQFQYQSYYPGQTDNSFGYYGIYGQRYMKEIWTSYGEKIKTGDTITMYYDATEGGTLGYMKNGVDMGIMVTSLNNYRGYGADLSDRLQWKFCIAAYDNGDTFSVNYKSQKSW